MNHPLVAATVHRDFNKRSPAPFRFAGAALIAACSGCLQSTPLSPGQVAAQAEPISARNDRPVRLTAAAPVGDASRSAIVPANFAGEWAGNVDCGKGMTELRLQLRPKAGLADRMEGFVRFKPLPGSRAETAAYLAEGAVSQASLKLRPTEWVVKAQRFPLQAMDATLLSGPERLNVRILDEKCRPLELTRPKFTDAAAPAAASPPSVSPAQPPLAAASGRAASRPMSYSDLLKVIGDARGDEKLAKPKLVGRTIQLTLKASGPQALMVNAKDSVFFVCQQRDPAFRGGLLVATITGYELSPDGDPSIELNRCSN